MQVMLIAESINGKFPGSRAVTGEFRDNISGVKRPLKKSGN